MRLLLIQGTSRKIILYSIHVGWWVNVHSIIPTSRKIAFLKTILYPLGQKEQAYGVEAHSHPNFSIFHEIHW